VVTPPYKPLPAERLYLGEGKRKERLCTEELVRLTPIAVTEESAIDVSARQGAQFRRQRAEPNANVFEALTAHVLALQAAVVEARNNCAVERGRVSA
jgi:transcription-repair coupling factor (superfamily II helicase)